MEQDKQTFREWWKKTGCRGISFCEITYKDTTKDNIRKWVQEFKGMEIKTRQTTAKKHVTIMQAGCLHIPKHDENFVSCFLQVAEKLKPDYVVLSGDIVDNSVHSRHNPALDVLMVEALTGKPILRKFLTDLKQHVKKEIIYIRGNHEAWIDAKKELDMALLHNPDFIVPKVLGFDDLGIHYEKNLWEYNDFVFKHGESIASGDNAPKMEFLGELKNGASSHTHRSGRYRHTTRTKQYVWYTTGCGCQLDMWYKLKGKSKVNSGWNHSFNVFKFVGNQFQCTQIEVIDGQCIYNGKLYKGGIDV